MEHYYRDFLRHHPQLMKILFLFRKQNNMEGSLYCDNHIPAMSKPPLTSGKSRIPSSPEDHEVSNRFTKNVEEFPINRCQENLSQSRTSLNHE